MVRPNCAACGWIQYRNPTVGVAAIVIEHRRLLLGLRGDGGWCIPCGHVEWDETIEEATVREFAEETGLKIEVDELYSAQSNFHRPELQTVGIWYKAHRISGQLRAGGDLAAVDFFDLASLPELKFPTDRKVAQQLFRE